MAFASAWERSEQRNLRLAWLSAVRASQDGGTGTGAALCCPCPFSCPASPINILIDVPRLHSLPQHRVSGTRLGMAASPLRCPYPTLDLPAPAPFLALPSRPHCGGSAPGRRRLYRSKQSRAGTEAARHATPTDVHSTASAGQRPPLRHLGSRPVCACVRCVSAALARALGLATSCLPLPPSHTVSPAHSSHYPRPLPTHISSTMTKATVM